jgi:hypothetical protein
MTEIERLVRVIHDLHGVYARHLGNATVHETFNGKTVWDGAVELFEVTGHATATRAATSPSRPRLLAPRRATRCAQPSHDRGDRNPPVPTPCIRSSKGCG